MADEKHDDEIPHFIEVRGCINCEASKHHKEQIGVDYGTDHESFFMCMGCEGVKYDISLSHPFFDPEEIVKMAKEKGKELAKNYGIKEEVIMENIRNYCLHVKDLFGQYYEKMGVSLDDIIKQLDKSSPPLVL